MGLNIVQNINFWAFLVFLALESRHLWSHEISIFESRHQYFGCPAQCLWLCGDKVLFLALSRQNLGLSQQSFVLGFSRQSLCLALSRQNLGFSNRNKVLSLPLSQQNLGLSRQSYVPCFVATYFYLNNLFFFFNLLGPQLLYFNSDLGV